MMQDVFGNDVPDIPIGATWQPPKGPFQFRPGVWRDADGNIVYAGGPSATRGGATVPIGPLYVPPPAVIETAIPSQVADTLAPRDSTIPILGDAGGVMVPRNPQDPFADSGVQGNQSGTPTTAQTAATPTPAAQAAQAVTATVSTSPSWIKWAVIAVIAYAVLRGV